MGWQDPFPQLPIGEAPIGENDPRIAKAWCKFNGSGAVSLDASENVSSITDNGTGDYTINFTTPFASADYAAVTGSRPVGGSPAYQVTPNKTAGSCGVVIWWDTGTGATFVKVDVDDISLVAFGDR